MNLGSSYTVNECYAPSCPSERHGRGQKLYKCSQCERQYYCSPKCQKADWAYHKQYCFKAGSGIKKQQNPQHDLIAVVERELQCLIRHNANAAEICTAARSAFKMGTPQDMSESHILCVQFEYIGPRNVANSKPVLRTDIPQLRSHFRFCGARILRIGTLEETAKLGGSPVPPDWLNDQKRMTKKEGHGYLIDAQAKIPGVAGGDFGKGRDVKRDTNGAGVIVTASLCLKAYNELIGKPGISHLPIHENWVQRLWLSFAERLPDDEDGEGRLYRLVAADIGMGNMTIDEIDDFLAKRDKWTCCGGHGN